MVLGIFKIALHLTDRHLFMRQWLEILNIFNALTLNQIFWKTKTFIKKLEYHFSVESTKTENAIFRQITALSEENFKQIEWRVQNEPVTKNRVLPVTTLFFWQFCFSLRTSYSELIWCTNYTKVHIHTFCERWSFIWGSFFLVSIVNLFGST